MRPSVAGAILLALAWPALAAPPDAVTIQRDAWGVPHVFTHGRRVLTRPKAASFSAVSGTRSVVPFTL